MGILSADAAGEILTRLRRNQLSRYLPYPKQYEFHALGREVRERLFMKGNRAGGTYPAGFETAMHLTGKYPDWWPGRKYDRPTVVVTGSESNESSRDIIQKILLGVTHTNKKGQGFGTGTIPGDDIINVFKRQAGIPNVLESIDVRHKSGGISKVMLKTYEQGRDKIQGFAADIAWSDEQVPDDIYTEMLARTMSAADGMAISTFTALKGETDLITRFVSPEDGDPVRGYTIMSVYETVGGIWPEGTPWAGEEWTGHFTKETADEFINSFPVHERETRALGKPMMGEGVVFAIPEGDITCPPQEIPKHWARICGIDFGIDHPAAGVWLAHDRDSDTIYVTDCYKMSGETAVYHAGAIKARDPQSQIPVAWPHDGMTRDKGTGVPLKEQYRKHGVRMMRDSARYDDKTGGAQGVEPAVLEIYERMKTGRFKVFANLSQWFDEFRMYHRKGGLIVAKKDDIMSATRIAVMELRHARTITSIKAIVNHPTKSMLGRRG